MMSTVEGFQNFLKLLSILAISVSLTLSPALAVSQECEYVYDGGQRVERAIKVDGQTFMYFNIDKSREMQKKLAKFDKMGEEIDLLDRQVQALKRGIDSRDSQIDLLKGEVDQFQEISLKAIGVKEDKGGLFNNPSFTYAAGVMTAVGMFFLWEYARIDK